MALPRSLQSCAALLLLTVLSLPSSAQDNPDLTGRAADEERKLDVSFLFHMNQDLVPQAKLASRMGYVGLLKVLRRHPNSPFQIQISGTLMNALTWFDDSAIQLIREGVDDGQFEVLGSTYSQNVMVASGSDFTNGWQIDTHLDLLRREFGVTPSGFWNPERTWTQSFVPLLSARGLRYTFIESHILEKSGVKTNLYLPRTTSLGDDQLTILQDDTRFIKIVDDVVNGGSVDTLEIYLRALFEADTTDRFLVTYLQDAEATGFWQYERGEDPSMPWKRLDSLLTIIEGWDWINITTGAEFVERVPAVEDVSPVSDGAASWMNDFSQRLRYEDWYDYLANDSLQQHFRTVLEPVRDSLTAFHDFLASSMIADRAAIRLFERAMRTFISHEYEWGASWYWFSTWADFPLAREALVSLTAARHALNRSSSIYSRDINQDGVEELVMTDPNNMFVLSRFGGRLLYWFDLQTGESLVGNENFGHYFEASHDGNHYLPVREGIPEVWPFHTHNAVEPEIFKWTFELRRRALNDWVSYGGIVVDSLVHRIYDAEIGQDLITFRYTNDRFTLLKRIGRLNPRENGLSVEYSLTNTAGRTEPVSLLVENGLSPSYITIMDEGADVLVWLNGDDSRGFDPIETEGVMNNVTGSAVRFEWIDQPFYVESGSPVFGVELNPVYQFKLDDSETAVIRFKLVSSH